MKINLPKKDNKMKLSELLGNRWVFGAVVFVVGALCGAVLSGCPAPEQEVTGVVRASQEEQAAPVTAPRAEAQPVTAEVTLSEETVTPIVTETPAAPAQTAH